MASFLLGYFQRIMTLVVLRWFETRLFVSVNDRSPFGISIRKLKIDLLPQTAAGRFTWIGISRRSFRRKEQVVTWRKFPPLLHLLLQLLLLGFREKRKKRTMRPHNNRNGNSPKDFSFGQSHRQRWALRLDLLVLLFPFPIRQQQISHRNPHHRNDQRQQSTSNRLDRFPPLLLLLLLLLHRNEKKTKRKRINEIRYL